MRLRNLKIENYGVFSGHEIEFSDGPRGESPAAGGFTLVYGPNEAGKSTLLQLIRELLFGFAHQNPYAFGWDSGEMAAETTIETADGRRVRFRRRKGLRATVVGEVETTGERIDEDGLARVLGGASQELYQNVFGFSLSELASGEKSLEQAGVGEALYGGGFGGLADFQRVQASLLKRQQTLYKPAAKKLPINSLLAAIRQKTKELREAALKPRDYERLHATCQRLESEAEELRERLEAMRCRSRHLERIETALSPWRRSAALREELERLSVPDGFPIARIGEFRGARSSLADLREEISQMEADLGEKRSRLDALQPAPELLQEEAAVRTLHQQVRQVQQFRQDIPLRSQESEALLAEARARLAELHPDWTLDQLEELQTSLAQSEAVRAMAGERSELRQRQVSLEAARPELRRRIGVLRARLDELAAVEEMAELRVLVERSTRYEVDRDRCEELDAEIGRLGHEVELLQPQVDALLRANAPAGEERPQRAALESLPVPLVAAVREVQGRLAGAAGDERAARKSLEEARAELARREEALGRLEARGQVPDRETLLVRRHVRDALWRRIRERCVKGEGAPHTGSAGVSTGTSRSGSNAEDEGPRDETQEVASDEPGVESEGELHTWSAGVSAGTSPSGRRAENETPEADGRDEDLQSLTVRYEREVREADALADERQARAELVAQAEHLGALAGEQRERVREAEALCGRERERRAALEREWAELWRPCELDPLAPEAMLEWMRLHSSLKEKLAQLRSLTGRRRTLEDRVRQFAEELRVALGSGDRNPDAPTSEATSSAPAIGVSLDVLLDTARRRVELAAEALRERELIEAELPDAAERLAAVDRELSETLEKTDEWLRRWRSLLGEFGFPATWEVDLVGKILDGLAFVREKAQEARSLDRRVAAMREQVTRFEADVAGVAGRVAADLRELPAEDAVLHLVERLDETKRAATERRTLAGEAAKVARRVGEKRERLEAVEGTVEELLRAARAGSTEEFEAAAQTATRASEIAEEIHLLERELRMIRGSEDESLFLEELERADGDAVASERERLHDEIAAADEKRQEVLREAGIARKTVDDLEAGDAMTRLSLELESLRAELAASCDEWASLALTRALIGRALRRFEQEHQPAMLREVARLLGAMTEGEYTGVTRKLDERGSLLVRGKGGDLKEPGALSRGTREQLYLAIRLAYVRRYCEDSEPLPLVMDDVLVNFDDARARSTLKALAEVSESVQILFLTCHRRVIELVREVLPAVRPIVLPKGESVLPAVTAAPWRQPERSRDPAAPWGPARDIFERRDRVEARSTPDDHSRETTEVPGKESSLRRRPGPLE